jgi:hypothetical protein
VAYSVKYLKLRFACHDQKSISGNTSQSFILVISIKIFIIAETGIIVNSGRRINRAEKTVGI